MNNLHVLRALENFRPLDAAAWAYATPERIARLRGQIMHYPAAALPDPENPTVICGIVHADGIGELWMLPGKGFRRSAPVVLGLAQQLLPMMYRALQLHRLALHVEAGRADARLWAERLGFVYETTLARAHRTGKDLEIYLWPHTKGDDHHVH